MSSEFSESANPVKNLFSFATKWEVFLMFIAAICSIGTGLAVPWNLLMFGDLVGAMVSAELVTNFASLGLDMTGFFVTDIMDSVTTFAVGTTFVGSIMLILTYASIFLFNYTSQKQIFRVRTMYFRSILHQDIGWYDIMNSGDVASRLTEDIIKYEDGIGEKFVMFLHNSCAVFGCIVVAFYSGWKLSLVCIAPFPVILTIIYKIARATSKIAQKEIEIYAVAGSIAEEALCAIRTVFAFGGEKEEFFRYTKNLLKTYKSNIEKSFLSGLGFGLLWFFIYATYSVAFWYGVNLILDERNRPLKMQIELIGSMATIFFSIMMATVNMSIAVTFIDTLTISRAAAVNIFSVIKRKSIIDSSSSVGLKPRDFQGTIEFKNVTFRYPSRPLVKVLNKLSFTINKGETVAIVGHSGCGKSTCIQLVQRFYDVEEGQILIDGCDIRDLNVKWFRSQLGVVGQEPLLFDTTVAENICIGDSNAPMGKIVIAAKEANAHDFIMKLPNRYSTPVGEGGTQISGGQKQRIAIARALIRNPRILLLDEATSALDSRSEAKVQAALNKIHKRRTTIIVAHRLSTIGRADKIIVLSNGQVVETGNHDYLMTLKGHYYSLVTAQVTEFIESISGELNNSYSAKKDQIYSDLMPTSEILNEDDDVIISKKASMIKILNLSKPEFPYLISASLSSIIVGCSPPVFSVLFGDVVGELSEPDTDEIRSRTNIYCIYFLVAGAVIAVTNFAQIAVEAVSNIRTIIGLGVEEICHNSYVKAMIPSFELATRNTHLRGIFFALARSAVYFAFAACMYYGGNLIKMEKLHYSSVFKVSQALIIGTVMVANASAFAPNFQKGLQAAESIISLLERKPKLQDPMYFSNTEKSQSDCVKYKKVVFEYPTRTGTRILDGLNLEIPHGKTVALIGPSGCGKSTIVQLLERFYTPVSGKVELDNKDIQMLPQSFLRMQLGLVSQEPTLFARSIAENIAYGDNTRQVPILEIIAAAKEANVHNFICALPHGYETKLGDRGTQLSGGQKQRIAIARALIRNPKILLLDEATSALDSESEKIVQAALDKTRKGRTCILIAHRISTVENADIICVLNSGQVVESGTHKELIAKKGMYYELLCLQNVRR
ncbi:ATP-dependent translocase ABCB1-like [Belonocnema kinseyi]|uniref:ATP-dependent translocase ABCB1-like n=1 Tax=Belonocnema kinseyi TaxID=2817044 RepID=UPI00143D141C|nr:ATP-dependent translocase ABCB1-like [Belonocnema kinseyi]